MLIPGYECSAGLVRLKNQLIVHGASSKRFSGCEDDRDVERSDFLHRISPLRCERVAFTYLLRCLCRGVWL